MPSDMFGSISATQEILDACDPSMALMESKRIQHLKQPDGERCSEGKDAALSITKYSNGWVWHCFRCHTTGFVPIYTLSPEKTEKLLNSTQNTLTKEPITHLSLPRDFIAIDSNQQVSVPWEVIKYLRKYEIYAEQCIQFGVGWSKNYNRLIIPLIDYTNNSELVGWIGRDVTRLTKAERIKQKRPKVILRKNKDMGHILFNTPAAVSYPIFSNVIVVVEDVISAIRINMIIGSECYALLNTFMPAALPLKNKNKIYLIWLDSGQEKNMSNLVHKFNSWGIDTTSKWTVKDPKDYDAHDIKRFLTNQMNKYYRFEGGFID